MTPMSRKIAKYTIPPAPKVPMPQVAPDIFQTVKNLSNSFSELAAKYEFLNKEVRIQREVYIQALTNLGYDIDRIRDLDRKIRKEIAGGK